MRHVVRPALKPAGDQIWHIFKGGGIFLNNTSGPLPHFNCEINLSVGGRSHLIEKYCPIVHGQQIYREDYLNIQAPISVTQIYILMFPLGPRSICPNKTRLSPPVQFTPNPTCTIPRSYIWRLTFIMLRSRSRRPYVINNKR